jgi:hypothetical protein
MPDVFRIDKADEIAVFVSAYFESTESEQGFSGLVPTAKNAGFERKRERIVFGFGFGDTTALRFYAGDKMVFRLSAHFESESLIAPGGIRNQVLHELTKAKIASLPVEGSESK